MALAARRPPDVFELNGGLTIAQLAQSQAVFSRWMIMLPKSSGKILYPEVFSQKQFYYKGKILIPFPNGCHFSGLIYNTDLFAAGLSGPPETLEQMNGNMPYGR